MATTKNSPTRADVVRKVLDQEQFLTAEERAVLAKMYASITAPRKKAEGPTKQQMLNQNLAAELVSLMKAHGEPVTAKWVSEHLNGVMTAQKAVAVIKAAGPAITKFYEGRTAMYRLS